MPEVIKRSGYKRATIYKRINERLWTKPIKIGNYAVGWPEDEVDALVAARISGQSKETILDMVNQLENTRKKP